MNSYFKAMNCATSNGVFPEYSDLWRSYHATSNMMDSDYCLFTKNKPVAPASVEPARTGQGKFNKILYVPVTRKVSLTDETNSSNLQ